MATAKKNDGPLIINKLTRHEVTVYVKGTSGLYFNSMSGKAMRDLLFPPGKPTAAEKKTKLKHIPRDEFRNSIYACPDGSPTLLGFPAAGFKGALASASEGRYSGSSARQRQSSRGLPAAVPGPSRG